MAIVENYPKDFQEFLNQFKGEDDCWNGSTLFGGL
jgi:hypothetical protein